jgi:hypothetical protein
MNKLKLNKGKAMACLMLTCILFASSCSKDRGYLLPQNDDLPVQNIKEETILKWIKTNPSAKLLSLNWNKAMQAVVNGKNVVRVPTLNVDKLSLLKNNSSLKPNMLASNNLPPGSSGARPKVGVNANYFTAHPPELFFVQENHDAPLKTYLLNFVPKNESEDFGQEGIWTGKLYEWNLNGDTVAVQEIEKNILKVGYLLKYGNNPGNNVMTNLKANKLQSTTGLKDKVVSGFWDWFTDLLADGAGWVGSLLGISGDYRNTVLDGWRIEVDWHAVFASGAGDPNNTQSNGYQGAGLMIYSAYAAGYSNGENLGGSSGGGYTPYHPTREFIELNPNDYIIGTLGITDPAQQDFLYTNLDIQIELSIWLDQHEHTPEANGFVRWAIGYLMANSNVNFEEFKNIFLPTTDIIADPNGDNWIESDNEILNDPDQTVYQQYQDTDLWPTVDRVIPFEKFVPNRIDASGHDVNCLVLAKEQLAKAGYTCSGYLPGSQTFQTYKELTGVDLGVTKKAISYIISSLGKKIPVLIGVDNRVGTPSIKNEDKSTDHFVVIVAMGTDDKGKYFQFMDSSTMIPATGASFSNRLYYNLPTGKITGKTANIRYRSFPGMHDYIVTQVRKSIKKQ